jgi:two-component system, cell cycle sensor histidine kinase and response regulator CckA
VAEISGSRVSLGRATALIRPNAAGLALAAVLAAILARLVPGEAAALGLVAASGALLALALVGWAMPALKAIGQRRRVAAISDFVEEDAAPVFVTGRDGRILRQNCAARNRYGDKAGAVLAAIIGPQIHSVSAVLHRLRSRAAARGTAREDVAVPQGQLRLSVSRIGPAHHLWRLEDITERPGDRGRETAPLPMLTVSRTGTVLWMNAAMKRLVGGRETAIERIVSDLPLRPGDVHRIAAVGGPVNARLIEFGEVAARRELCLIPADAVGTPAEWRLLDALPVPLLRVAETGEILLSNRLARNLLEIEKGATPNLAELVTGLGRPVSEWLADAAAGRGTGRAEVVRAARPAMEVHLQIALGRVEEPDGTSLVAVLHDATELKTLEAQFVQSQKMQAIGQLAGGVAHDFNNLLTAISGHCDLLLLKRDPGHPDYADLEQINQNANRAASLVSQLLAFSRKQTLQPQLLDLRDTLADLAHLLNRLVGEKITLALSHDPDLRLVRADKRQLEQVLMNLVVNARDAMPAGGTITISTEARHVTAPLERDRAVVPPGDYVVVTVTDEGSGIPRDKLPKIFEPFFTTKRLGEGTGLGLSTAYGIVKQTGGYIFADSIPGSGSTFTIMLPAHDRPLPATERPLAEAPAAPPLHGDGVVLLVEDEAPVRAFASRALRLRGFTVLEAESAEEALGKLEDLNLAVDVFVTDVIMPGMDGPSWVAKALETRPDTRVVFVSGYAEDSLAESRLRIPNAVFLPKPFSLKDLTATVQRQMH